MGVNVFDKPADQHVVQKVLPLPYEEIARTAFMIQGKSDKLDEDLIKQKNIFKGLKNLSIDDPRVEELQAELTNDVQNFYKVHNNLADPRAQRAFYELEQKWAGDTRAKNFERNYTTVTEAMASRKKSQTDDGNQDYNFRGMDESLQEFIKQGGTYATGFDADPNLYVDPGFTKYVSEADIRKPFEDAVNNMVANASTYQLGSDGKYIYKGNQEIRERERLRFALDSQKNQLMTGLVGENLVNKYSFMYPNKTEQEVKEIAWNEMRASVVDEYFYNQTERFQSNDSRADIGYKFELENPLSGIERTTEAVNIKNPHGASIAEYNEKLGAYDQTLRRLDLEFVTDWMNANNVTSQTPEQFITTTGFTLSRLGEPGFEKLGMISPAVADKYAAQHAEISRQKTIAESRMSEIEAQVIKELGLTPADVNAKALNYAQKVTEHIDLSSAKIKKLELQKAIAGLDGYSLTASAVDDPRSTGYGSDLVLNKPDGTKVYLESEGGVAKGQISYLHKHAMGSTRPDVRGQIQRGIEKALADDSYQPTGWAQEDFPAFKTVLGANGKPMQVIDPDGTRAATLDAKKYFKNYSNLNGFNLITTQFPEGTTLSNIKQAMGVPDDAKPGDLQIGDPLLSKSAKLRGQSYVVIPISYGNVTTEVKVLTSEVQNPGIKSIMSDPLYIANSAWEEGKQYKLKRLVPYKGKDIQFVYGGDKPLNDRVIIDGKQYTPDEGMPLIAEKIRNREIY